MNVVSARIIRSPITICYCLNNWFLREREFDTTKPVGMHRKLLDISEQKKLGWKPAKSLQEGLKEAYHYFNQEDDLTGYSLASSSWDAAEVEALKELSSLTNTLWVRKSTHMNSVSLMNWVLDTR